MGCMFQDFRLTWMLWGYQLPNLSWKYLDGHPQSLHSHQWCPLMMSGRERNKQNTKAKNLEFQVGEEWTGKWFCGLFQTAIAPNPYPRISLSITLLSASLRPNCASLVFVPQDLCSSPCLVYPGLCVAPSCYVLATGNGSPFQAAESLFSDFLCYRD